MQRESQKLLVRGQRRTVNWSGLGIDVNMDVVREHPYDPAWYFNTSEKEWEKRLGVREAAGELKTIQGKPLPRVQSPA